MNTFVIYDENGDIILTQAGGNDFPTSIGTAIVEVPDGKEISHVNVETGEVILVDAPKTAEQIRLDALEAQMATLAGMEV